MELNPNHPVTRQMRDQWHKIAALIMVKFNATEVQITPEDLKKLAGGNINIVVDARGEAKTGAIAIRLVDDKTAAQLAREQGGRAIDS